MLYSLKVEIPPWSIILGIWAFQNVYFVTINGWKIKNKGSFKPFWPFESNGVIGLPLGVVMQKLGTETNESIGFRVLIFLMA